MRYLFPALLACLALTACNAGAEPVCEDVTFEGQGFVVCTVDPQANQIRLELTHPDGDIYGQFDRVDIAYAKNGAPLIFAMNAGMYHDDRRPVGLYVQDGEQTAPLVTTEGPGNFGLVPNGVFWIKDDVIGVLETSAYADTFEADMPDFATQSGPMLVIDGELHPAFNADGTSRKRRNGVGVSKDGSTLYVAISDVPVNFHTFARLFRDELETPNALFLDGTVSKLYSAELDRNERGLAMGPILTVSSP